MIFQFLINHTKQSITLAGLEKKTPILMSKIFSPKTYAVMQELNVQERKGHTSSQVIYYTCQYVGIIYALC